MEPQPLAKHVDSSPRIRFFDGSTSRQDDPEGSSAGPSKRKINEVVPHDVSVIVEDEDPFGEEDSMSTNQKAMLGYDKMLPIQIKDSLSEDHSSLGLATSSVVQSKTAALDPQDLSSSDKFNSDSMDVDDDDLNFVQNDDNYIDDDDYYDDIDDDGYDFSLDAQFDAQNLPAGVEATVPWLQVPATSSTFQYQPFSSKQLEEKDGEIMKKFQEFKHFDTVDDCSDHYYVDPNKSFKRSLGPDSIISGKDSSQGGSLTKKTQLDWSKKIQDEWKILENHLPETIFVRVYEERIDLMRAVIVGPPGTPYHDGLFFFDILFPCDYPAQPPKVYYHSGGLRLNPNLYDYGKVCLSLLNTWNGSKNEMWTPGVSTILQVLVSIQGLVLNAKPYFNEPGYEKSAGKPDGERRALAYNEDTFILSCKTMLYTLRKPPKHFEDFVMGHFRQRAHAILESCRAYMDGTQVGHPRVMAQDANKGRRGCFSNFKNQLEQMFPMLLVAFTDNGADCKRFLPEKPDNGADCSRQVLPEKPDTTLKL
ncbi:hypothetical protein MRB53_026690 [Persea americana]|uniref:Uncharacterized protein n=1 Tax=Persea americana TaxID=3435 RepID=A0ACC2LIX4_PERAE|nr:hypothetical protein MRB53_026690 [Persea americana]|eukprot:TRINITY_DN38012_c0_g1_i4.p1 TRINITY_DN38012_c0_g1~~TRINITY_DN38012_c0_g1_i4.p1  ORF type:complete len:533 (-),score=106.76 TRINITY_DN38012_c0_g1_i4:317-1915(-)